MSRWALSLPLAAAAAALFVVARPARAQNLPPAVNDSDLTLRAMRDELARSVQRLQLPGVEKPFYLEYRLLDLDVRNVTASFGAIASSTTARNRFMIVGARLGDYHLDSSNFITDEGFRGFLGPAGQVGIDRDYNSLRQDLWLATDQAYKEAATQMSLKKSFLRSLTRPPEIDDFSKELPIVEVNPRLEPDWTSRNWDAEAREASAALQNFPELYGARVNYHLVYATSYLMTSEGTEIRVSRSLAAIEAGMDTQADDGMPLHNFYSIYGGKPADLPSAADAAKALAKAAQDLRNLRASPLASDYTGPVLFDAPAAGALLAQLLGPSVSGARPPLSMLARFEEMMESLGGHSEWTGRLGQRVLPASVTLFDDPAAKDFQAQPLIGGYSVDDEGVRAQRIALVENGILKSLLMSRRPGPEFQNSNGHGRSVFLSDPRPLASNLFLKSSDALGPDALRKKFLDLCRADGHQWCLEIRRMDNPALSSLRQEDFNDLISAMASGIASGERLPLLVSRVYVSDGHAELVRGGWLNNLSLRSLRNLAAIGDDPSVYNFFQSVAVGYAGTPLAAFGSAQGGVPSSIVAPSLLLEEADFRGYHGEPRRTPLLPAPPLR